MSAIAFTRFGLRHRASQFALDVSRTLYDKPPYPGLQLLQQLRRLIPDLDRYRHLFPYWLLTTDYWLLLLCLQLPDQRITDRLLNLGYFPAVVTDH